MDLTAPLQRGLKHAACVVVKLVALAVELTAPLQRGLKHDRRPRRAEACRRGINSPASKGFETRALARSWGTHRGVELTAPLQRGLKHKILKPFEGYHVLWN